MAPEFGSDFLLNIFHEITASPGGRASVNAAKSIVW